MQLAELTINLANNQLVVFVFQFQNVTSQILTISNVSRLPNYHVISGYTDVFNLVSLAHRLCAKRKWEGLCFADVI